jgi:hypothetical protein
MAQGNAYKGVGTLGFGGSKRIENKKEIRNEY